MYPQPFLAPGGRQFPPCCRLPGNLRFPLGYPQARRKFFFSGPDATRTNPPPEHWTQTRKFASIAAKQKP